ncbi:MAG: hypothetical protein IPJ31_13785 [Bacteroidetes bacterium]|nr:hypothetical protein [Bacteroidota bacterium]
MEKTDSYKKFIKIKGFGITTDNFIVITKESITEFIVTSEKFLNDILDLLKEN